MNQNMKRRLLRVNLTTRQIDLEKIPPEDIQMFVGGRALGDMLLYQELAPGTDPLSSQNKILFSIGPLTGTNAPGSSRYIVHTKSPLTGLYLSSLAGGYFGPELRKAGYDAILIEGKSESPVYLKVTDDEVEIRDANPLWGMTTEDVQKFIKDEAGSNKSRIACIGPAGENLVPYAAIISERRAVGRGGAGAVMGSKNLKAIAVTGTGKIGIADPDGFQKAVKHAMEETTSHPISKVFPLYGSNLAMPALNKAGIIPWRNWQEAASPECEKLFAENWREKFVKKDVRCAPPCHFKCGKICLATEGPHAGVLTEGPEYEAEYALGTCCNITDQAAIIEADALCDQYGLDVISMGVSLAFAMECYERGIITDQDTFGEELRFGQARLLAKLIRDTAYRRGFGDLLSQGTKRMAERFGQGSEAFAMHAKGMELGGYDPRGAKSLAMVFACGSRGGCHKSGGSGNALSVKEVHTGDARFSPEGKAGLTKESREDRVLADSAILCIFLQGPMSSETMAELLNAATASNYSPEDLNVIGERGSNIERAFNVREGLRRSWDTLPPRLLHESVKSGPTKGQVVELETLLSDFYNLCGWDIETGIPTPEKLNELGLQRIAKDMENHLK
jgi:aldehyde:ferredoxin oxidoreductase